MKTPTSPLFCPICGRILPQQAKPHGAHPYCCKGLFGVDRMPTFRPGPQWKDHLRPLSGSSYVIPLRQDPRKKILEPSDGTHTRFLLKIPTLENRYQANKRTETEWMTMLLARIFGIPALHGTLTTLPTGYKGYIMPRLDRGSLSRGSRPIHIETLSQTFLWQNHEEASSIVARGNAIQKISACPKMDSIDFLLRGIFSFLFSVPACSPQKLILKETGTGNGMKLAPAYGLRIVPENQEALLDDYVSLFFNRRTYLSFSKGLRLECGMAVRLLERTLSRKERLLQVFRTIPLREMCEERRYLSELTEQRFRMLKALV